MVEMILLNGVILYGPRESPETCDNRGKCERKDERETERECKREIGVQKLKSKMKDKL